ncbi:hypothetical protein D0Z07_0319 [Hyphodiscus hymeniophilus]|uniref:Uncharacterized protein n=1 Tax=Hyphodiscus hymeniophilus TaxID=353542 RepID=A0A9P7B1E0_9HELO|nr:hypothetical protein D0Z07_0319 [Hyphodiscus hymeniophilus]
MSCITVPNLFSRIGNSCLHTFGRKPKPQPLNIVSPENRPCISAPFDFKEGPAFNFQDLGYSEEEADLDLMREKAIASTAITENGEYDFAARIRRPQSRASSHTCGLGSKVVYHARRKFEKESNSKYEKYGPAYAARSYNVALVH